MLNQEQSKTIALKGADILWQGTLQKGKALLLEDSKLKGLVDDTVIPAETKSIALNGGFLAPGFVDLQVNGGGGVLFNNAPTVETLSTMSQAHAAMGTTSFLPTLITDSPETTSQAIAAVEEAIAARVPGVLGLHLEGPHIAPNRRGAHRESFVRPMNDRDMAVLLRAAQALPVLKVTLAPEHASEQQVRDLTDAGVVVSIGHTDADYETCLSYAKAGANCVTHLFNAQSQMTPRAPGTVGAALSLGAFNAGLIADGIHVDPTMISLALRANKGPGEIFLVTDAMATIGSDLESFTLNGREILRSGDRLTLTDGTLAGAHLALADAIKLLVSTCGEPVEIALKRATQYPADVIGKSVLGRLFENGPADFVHLSSDFALRSVWRGGKKVRKQKPSA